ncbi:hypothetical protein VCRA219O171_60147 [Vibrio crassostreae]|nr:hypothetical protein VCRA219O171_60147 [Vibrio crassostreae]CAK3070835.1 hypothetical protein VCRA2120O255_60145 [Vibrio crassostreae]
MTNKNYSFCLCFEISYKMSSIQTNKIRNKTPLLITQSTIECDNLCR